MNCTLITKDTTLSSESNHALNSCFFWGEKNLTLFCGHYCIFFNKSCSHVFNDIVVCKRKMQAQLDLAAFYRVFCLSRNPETRSLALLINLKLSIIDIRSQNEKKVVNDPLPFPFFFLFLRLPTSTNVTLNHAKLDNFCLFQEKK